MIREQSHHREHRDHRFFLASFADQAARGDSLSATMAHRSLPLRIAIDTGGTFTDCVWIDPSTNRLRMLKVFSTPEDPSRAIVEALQKITTGDFVLWHGTTVGTNTLLERKGARTALVT